MEWDAWQYRPPKTFGPKEMKTSKDLGMSYLQNGVEMQYPRLINMLKTPFWAAFSLHMHSALFWKDLLDDVLRSLKKLKASSTHVTNRFKVLWYNPGYILGPVSATYRIPCSLSLFAVEMTKSLYLGWTARLSFSNFISCLSRDGIYVIASFI